jgi:hypothetical protein
VVEASDAAGAASEAEADVVVDADVDRGMSGPLPPQATRVKLNSRADGYAVRFKTGYSWNSKLVKVIPAGKSISKKCYAFIAHVSALLKTFLPGKKFLVEINFHEDIFRVSKNFGNQGGWCAVAESVRESPHR